MKAWRKKSITAALLLAFSLSATAHIPLKGVRSVQINLANMTQTDLTVQNNQQNLGATAQEALTINNSVAPYQTVQFGTYTPDFRNQLTQTIVLTGYGHPIILEYQLTPQNQFSYQVSGNDQIYANVQRVETGQINHPQLNISLIPNNPSTNRP